MAKHNRRDTTPKAANGTPHGVLSRSARPSFLPPDMVLEPISRRPTVLPQATVRAVLELSPGAARYSRSHLPERFEPAVSDSSPRVSVVVITRDHLAFTKLCLESVLANTEYPDFELIVVDNGSGEELLSYLDHLTDRFPFIRVVRNVSNCGFAAAVNQGLVQATGERFVLLNNDTIVPDGWLTPLVRHLDDPQVGAVGPVTNRTSNEAQIETSYRTYAEFEDFASDYTTAHAGERFDIPMLTMYCFAMRRETHSQIGPLDEAFHIAMFEDDDYALRLRSHGYRLVCAEDVFVHHFGGVSLGSLLDSGECQELLKANRERFQRKWGVEWQSHRHRPGPTYQRLITGIREVVRKVIPAGATVLVISKGDPELIDLAGRDARHFPVDADGSYAGYHPAGSTDAINHLTALQSRGAEYLVIPSPAFWWLEHYAGFADYLAGAGEETYRATDLCVIFHLPRPPQDRR